MPHGCGAIAYYSSTALLEPARGNVVIVSTLEPKFILYQSDTLSSHAILLYIWYRIVPITIYNIPKSNRLYLWCKMVIDIL